MAADIEIRHCRALIAVADCGGMSPAARALGLAQSTVSETLLSLERVVGAPLTLRRPGVEVALTATARTLLPLARALVSASEAARAAVAGDQRSVVRLGAIESVSSYLLPSVLAAFRGRRPLVEIQVTTGLCAELRELVGRGELDVALTVQAGVEPEVGQAPGRYEAHRLADVSLRLIASPGDPLASGSAPRGAIAQRGLLLPDPDGTLNRMLRAWFAGAGEEVRFESAGSLDGLKRGVLASTALGVIPSYAVADELRSGLLVEVSPAQPLPPVYLELAVQARSRPFPALSDLIADIEAAMSDQAPRLRT